MVVRLLTRLFPLALWLCLPGCILFSQTPPFNARLPHNPTGTCVSQSPSFETDLSIPVSSLATGAVSASTFPGLSNPAAVVFSSSYWTAGRPIKYIAASDYRYPIATSIIATSRDMEVTTWSRNGVVLLRLNGGTAIYFEHNGETVNGSLTIGVVTGFVPGQGFIYGTSAVFRQLYTNDNLVGTAPGYSKIETAGAQFTFGVSGFDVYARFNGVEFVRFKQLYHTGRGAVALQANTGYGFRDVGIRLMADHPLHSATDCNVIDARDFGAAGVSAVGSIAAGSNELNLESDPGFAVGDTIIIETGGEAGAGLRGTPGVGGYWPALTYTTVDAMNADSTQPQWAYAVLPSTGDVWQWNSTTWSQVNDYYLAKMMPKALVARITGIHGTVLSLDTPAETTAASAKVYKDNWAAFNNLFGDPGNYLLPLLPANIAVSIPSGEFAFSNAVAIGRRVGWTIVGAGVDATTLFSPHGVPSQAINISAGHDNTIADLTLRGNARFQGYTLPMGPIGPLPGVRQYPPGILFSTSDNGVARNVKAVDVFMDAVGTSYSNNVWAYNCTAVMTDGLQRYVQWMFQWADSNGGGCVDCAVRSPVLTAGFETFRSNGVTFTRPVGVNAVISSNSSGNFLFDSPNLTITPNSQLSTVSFSPYNPIININSNIQPPSQSVLAGGVIRNPMIHEVGPINAQNDVLRAIVVNLNNPNVKIIGEYPSGRGGTITLPGWQPPSKLQGAVGVNSTGQTTIVSGIRVIGTTDATWDYNIGLSGSGSAVTDSIADRITAPIQSGNMNNAQWDASSRKGNPGRR